MSLHDPFIFFYFYHALLFVMCGKATRIQLEELSILQNRKDSLDSCHVELD
jgi:hypothetical protein